MLHLFTHPSQTVSPYNSLFFCLKKNQPKTNILERKVLAAETLFLFNLGHISWYVVMVPFQSGRKNPFYLKTVILIFGLALVTSVCNHLCWTIRASSSSPWDSLFHSSKMTIIVLHILMYAVPCYSFIVSLYYCILRLYRCMQCTTFVFITLKFFMWGWLEMLHLW